MKKITDKQIVAGAILIGIALMWYLQRNSAHGVAGVASLPSLAAPSTNVPAWLTVNNDPAYQGVVPTLPLQLPSVTAPSASGSTCAACQWW